MDGVRGGVEGRKEEGTGKDTQASGPSAWWVAVPLPEVGRRADRKGRGGNPVWGMLGLRHLQIARRRLQRPWQSQAL